MLRYACAAWLTAAGLWVGIVSTGRSHAQTHPAPEADSAGLGTTRVIPTILWQDAGGYLGKEVFLVGKIVRTGRSRTGHVFLNFSDDYRGTATLFIRKENLAAFPQPPDRMYRNRLVKVRGFLYDHQGTPNITVGSLAAIEMLPSDATLPPPASAPASAPATRPVGDTISIACYNLLNLFDDADDPYTSDETTGPKSRTAVEALAASIRRLDADILAVVEVENRGALQQFVDRYLSDLGYEVVLFEGNDQRGIDVGLLSRLPVGPVTSHRHLRLMDLNGRPMHFQRDFLQVRIEPPDGLVFDVFVVHFKSKSGEEDSGLEIRLPEARAARGVLDRVLTISPNAAFLVCGDFNDLLDSEPLQALIGSGPTRLRTFIDDLPPDNRVTYNQQPYRSMIDLLLASPAMARQYVPGSCNILPGSPETTGSDHNPVLARFRIK